MLYAKSIGPKESFIKNVFSKFTDSVGGDPKEFADILFHKYVVDDFAYHDDMIYYGVVKYFEETVVPHKIAVYDSGIWLTEQPWFEKYLKGFAVEDFKYNLWCHDMSKFSANESFGYACYNRSTGSGKDAFERSWHHHKQNNPHHPEYWFNPNRSGQLEPIPMPALYVMEMIADWMGAGKTYGATLEKWLPDNLHKFRFGSSRKLVQDILSDIGIQCYMDVDLIAAQKMQSVDHNVLTITAFEYQFKHQLNS